MFRHLMTPQRLALGLAAAITIALVPSLVAAQAATSTWRTSLTGAGEVPANASTATGTFTGTLDEAAGTLTWTLSVPTISNMTMSHLHQGAPGANGGVVLDLFIPPTGTTPGTVNASGTAKLSDLKGPLAGNAAGFITALKAGNIYANVHTTANPGGEIRGQVVDAAAPAAAKAAAPAPGKTGSAGLPTGTSTSLVVIAGLLAVAGVVTLLGRRSTGDR